MIVVALACNAKFVLRNNWGKSYLDIVLPYAARRIVLATVFVGMAGKKYW
jgi:hypothetical protein